MAKRAFPEFQKFVRQFGDFVDNRRSDTLHAIAMQELCRSNASDLDKLRVPALPLFTGFCHYFAARTNRQAPSLDALEEAITEFHHLISAYNNWCVNPIFDRFPQELAPSLTPSARSSLNSFQQRFANFLDDYSDFVRGLADSGTISSSVAYGFSRPKPL